MEGVEEASFPQFGSLPPEIRRLIWTETLPQEDEPAMAVFGLRWMLPWVDPNKRNEEFQRIGRLVVQVPTPTAMFVCREARDVVLRWLDARPGYTRRLREETQALVYTRDFDRSRDLFYIPRDQWDIFSAAFIAVDRDEEVLRAMGASITNLALPAFTAYYGIDKLEGVLEFMTNLRAIYAVWGELPRPRKASRPLEGWPDHIAEVQPRWEIHEVPWDADVRLCFVDPADGTVSYEEGDLETFHEEIDEQWAMCESVPPQFVNEEFGIVDVPHKHITIKEFRCP